MWAHAISLSEKHEQDSKKAELLFMKDLFYDKLPVGPDMTKIDQVFNSLEQVIDNKDIIIQNDEFDDTPAIEAGIEPEYKYYSSAIFKERSIQRDDFALPQNMERGPTAGQPDDPVSPQHSKFKSLPRISELPASPEDRLFEQLSDLEDC